MSGKMLPKRITVLLEFCVIVLLWHLIATYLNRSFLPLPLTVFKSIIVELTKSLGTHMLISAMRVTVSILLSLCIALPLAFLSAQFVHLDDLINPLVNLAYPIPKIVFLPLFLLFFGVGDTSKILLISLVIFFHLFVIIRDSIGQIKVETIDSIRSLNAKWWQIILYVYLPAGLPATFTALKIALGSAIAVLFFAESFATETGLGFYIMVETWGRLDYANMYAGVFAMGIMGLFFYAMLSLLEKILCPWQKGIGN